MKRTRKRVKRDYYNEGLDEGNHFDKIVEEDTIDIPTCRRSELRVIWEVSWGRIAVAVFGKPWFWVSKIARILLQIYKTLSLVHPLPLPLPFLSFYSSLLRILGGRVFFLGNFEAVAIAGSQERESLPVRSKDFDFEIS